MLKIISLDRSMIQKIVIFSAREHFLQGNEGGVFPEREYPQSLTHLLHSRISCDIIYPKEAVSSEHEKLLEYMRKASSEYREVNKAMIGEGIQLSVSLRDGMGFEIIAETDIKQGSFLGIYAGEYTLIIYQKDVLHLLCLNQWSMNGKQCTLSEIGINMALTTLKPILEERDLKVLEENHLRNKNNLINNYTRPYAFQVELQKDADKIKKNREIYIKNRYGRYQIYSPHHRCSA